MSTSDTSSLVRITRFMTIGMVASSCLGLTGCVGLMATKASGQSVATADPAPAPATPSPMAAAVAQQNVSGYVDPLVSKKQQPAKQQKSNPALAHSAKPQTPSEAPQSSTTAQPEQPQNSLANVIQEPTAVHAGQNSIFAIANAKVAEAQGVPAYAPVRNINPMSGSVFSARTSAAAATSTPMSAGDKNGLW